MIFIIFIIFILLWYLRCLYRRQAVQAWAPECLDIKKITNGGLTQSGNECSDRKLVENNLGIKGLRIKMLFNKVLRLQHCLITCMVYIFFFIDTADNKTPSCECAKWCKTVTFTCHSYCDPASKLALKFIAVCHYKLHQFSIIAIWDDFVAFVCCILRCQRRSCVRTREQ